VSGGVRLDIARLQTRFHEAHRGRASRHLPADRVRPSILQYDYLTLRALSAHIRELIEELPPPAAAARALDLGSDRSPYRSLLEGKGFEVRTLDITRESGADYEGTAEGTNLPNASFDLVLCTQVLEHCASPWRAVHEIHRILRPGGHLILSVPHVWFYHPHPSDHWRFTQEGVVRLCEEGGLTPLVLLAQGGAVATAVQVINFLLYGVLGRSGAPVYAVANLLGRAGDRALRNGLFCGNFACLALRS
jgi:SAM-dependent methyltransferase